MHAIVDRGADHTTGSVLVCLGAGGGGAVDPGGAYREPPVKGSLNAPDGAGLAEYGEAEG